MLNLPIIESDTGKPTHQFDQLPGDISAIGWSPTDARIAFGNGIDENGRGLPYTLQVWQAPAE